MESVIINSLGETITYDEKGIELTIKSYTNKNHGHYDTFNIPYGSIKRFRFSSGTLFISANGFSVEKMFSYQSDIKGKLDHMVAFANEKIAADNLPRAEAVCVNTSPHVNTSPQKSYTFHYVISILIPLIGFILGAIMLASDDGEKSSSGKTCIILGIIAFTVGALAVFGLM